MATDYSDYEFLKVEVAERVATITINRPDSLNNFQSQLTVDQVLYDAGQTRNAVKSAELSHQMSGEEQRRTQMQVMAGLVTAYWDAVMASESLRTAQQAVRSAEADLKRADSSA